MERVGWGSHQPEGRAGAMRSAEWVDLHRLLESSQSARTPGIAEPKKNGKTLERDFDGSEWFVVRSYQPIKFKVIDGY